MMGLPGRRRWVEHHLLAPFQVETQEAARPGSAQEKEILPLLPPGELGGGAETGEILDQLRCHPEGKPTLPGHIPGRGELLNQHFPTVGTAFDPGEELLAAAGAERHADRD